VRKTHKRNAIHFGELSDKNMSGGRADNRPGLQAAFRETIKHKATLVVYSRDRLARENADDATIVHRLIRVGADLESVTEPFDIKDEAGEFIGGMLAADRAFFPCRPRSHTFQCR
jgi:DNA invertase Pin-like site-specific DNA recombinase